MIIIVHGAYSSPVGPNSGDSAAIGQGVYYVIVSYSGKAADSTAIGESSYCASIVIDSKHPTSYSTTCSNIIE